MEIIGERRAGYKMDGKKINWLMLAEENVSLLPLAFTKGNDN